MAVAGSLRGIVCLVPLLDPPSPSAYADRSEQICHEVDVRDPDGARAEMTKPRLGLLGIVIAILLLVALILATMFCAFPWSMAVGTAQANLSVDRGQWTVYFPARVSDACGYLRYDSVPSDTLGDPPPFRRPSVPVSAEFSESVLVFARTPSLLRPSIAPGKPLPVRDWLLRGSETQRSRASTRLGMFTMERDSCWQEVHPVGEMRRWYPPGQAPDSLKDWICVPAVSLLDTSGVCRKIFIGARDPTWSPDGTQLAFRTVRSSMMRTKTKTYQYPEAAESLGVFSPTTGRLDVYPTPADAFSWLDEETLFLAVGERRYGLKLPLGEPYNPSAKVPAGVFSPDHEYSFKLSGRSRIWKGEPAGLVIWGVRENRDLSTDLIRALGNGIAQISVRSFWLRGPGHEHDLCLGIGWMTKGRSHNLVAKYSDCEVVVIDVEEAKVTKRIPGAFVGPSADETHIVIWKDGRMEFVKLEGPVAPEPPPIPLFGPLRKR